MFDLLSPEQLMQAVGSSTIIDDMCDILAMALQRPYDGPIYLKSDKEIVSAMT